MSREVIVRLPDWVVHWSGVRIVERGASREHAERVGFEEEPVFPESYAYLERRGLRFTRGILRERATAVLEAYRDGGGVIYNA